MAPRLSYVSPPNVWARATWSPRRGLAQLRKNEGPPRSFSRPVSVQTLRETVQPLAPPHFDARLVDAGLPRKNVFQVLLRSAISCSSRLAKTAEACVDGCA